MKYIPEIEGCLNDVENTTTEIAPFELYKGLPVHDPIVEALKLPSSAVDRGNLILLAATRMKTYHEKFDSRAKPGSILRIGDLVVFKVSRKI